jgi:hypothetical protein
MSTAIAPPASRNAPCPCGSGRRYKECHGRAAAPNDAPQRVGTGELLEKMHAALAAQRAGRFDEAIAAYDDVIRLWPGTYDAWHMRGVAHLQSHRFDEAEADITQALTLNPELPMGRSNLALVEGGRRMAIAEERVSRATWPRFRALVADAAAGPLDGVAGGTRCFVVDLGAASHSSIGWITSRAAALGADVHRVSFGANGRPAPADEAALRATGAGDVIVAVGTQLPLGDWTLACAPRAIALVVDGDRLDEVQDRLRELSGQRRRRVRLAATHDAPLDLNPLPHARLSS